jgi:hypothetical protein
MNAEATSVRAAKRIGAAIPGSWPSPSDAAVRAAARLMLVPARMLATAMGRRVAAATLLSVALVAMVASLYANAEGGVAAPAARATPVAASKPTGAAPARAASAATPAPAAAPAGAARPEDAAAAWFARQRRVPVNHVKALQRQQISATVTKVLVLAQVSPSDMPTAFVTVRRDRAGWKVP